MSKSYNGTGTNSFKRKLPRLPLQSGITYLRKLPSGKVALSRKPIRQNKRSTAIVTPRASEIPNKPTSETPQNMLDYSYPHFPVTHPPAKATQWPGGPQTPQESEFVNSGSQPPFAPQPVYPQPTFPAPPAYNYRVPPIWGFSPPPTYSSNSNGNANINPVPNPSLEQSKREPLDPNPRHKCIFCGRYRSPAYHSRHPISPGKSITGGVCRKCENYSTTSEDNYGNDKKGKGKSFSKNKKWLGPADSLPEDTYPPGDRHRNPGDYFLRPSSYAQFTPPSSDSPTNHEFDREYPSKPWEQRAAACITCGRGPSTGHMDAYPYSKHQSPGSFHYKHLPPDWHWRGSLYNDPRNDWESNSHKYGYHDWPHGYSYYSPSGCKIPPPQVTRGNHAEAPRTYGNPYQVPVFRRHRRARPSNPNQDRKSTAPDQIQPTDDEGDEDSFKWGWDDSGEGDNVSFRRERRPSQEHLRWSGRHAAL